MKHLNDLPIDIKLKLVTSILDGKIRISEVSKFSAEALSSIAANSSIIAEVVGDDFIMNSLVLNKKEFESYSKIANALGVMIVVIKTVSRQ